MCGRFVSTTPPDELASYFQVDVNGIDSRNAERSNDRTPHHGTTTGRYNVAPTAEVFVVYEDGDLRRLDGFHWGLVPGWAQDLKVGNRMINARAETVAEEPAFRRAFAKRRCIVPVDGFYEWTKEPDPNNPKKPRKQPHYISRPDGEPYAFAGLWERWRGDLNGDGTETEVRSTTIITTAANEPMSELHDRMPVMLAPDHWDAWLDPGNADTDALGQLLVPAPARLITHHRVSVEGNNARNQGPHLIDPVDPPAASEQLNLV